MKIILVINTSMLIFAQLQQINAADDSLYKIQQQSERIVDGTVTYIKKAKFVVYIRRYGEHYCGGSLVTPKYVVTAAHCVEEAKKSDLSVIGGATYLTEKGVERNVSKIIAHKNYDPSRVNMDIAILKLSRAMTGANISPIELCKTNLKANDQISVYGWGQMSENNPVISNQLRVVNVPIVDQRKCKKMYRDYYEITPAMFCAGDLRGKDSCQSDSGGPAVFKNQLCGVISWGIGCGRREFPGVYTNVMFVRDFIDKVIKEK